MTGRAYRIFMWLATALPLAATVTGAVLLWRGQVRMSDLVSFAVMYALCIIGVTVGFHRLLAHRSFTTTPSVRLVLAVAGSMAGQGPAIVWAAHHRRHHRLTDKQGDPHSPYVDADGAELGGIAGWWHAHVGWLLDEDLSSNPVRYCPDLARDPALRWVSRRFVPLVLAGIGLAALIGYALSGELAGAVTGALWGGLIRLFVLNQVTYSINSFTHMYGRRPFATPDESRNAAWLALASFGEAWHNNHHAFPRSARFGFHPWQVDIGGMVVRGLEALGLARSVVRVGDEERVTRQRKLASAGGGRRAAAVAEAPVDDDRPRQLVPAADVD